MSDEINVTVEGVAHLMRALAKMDVDVGDALEEIVTAAADGIRAEADRRIGTAINGTETRERKRTGVTVAVGPVKEKWYYRFFEFGAGPHIIERRRARWLTFVGKDGFLRKLRVQHPGMSVHRPFLRPAADDKRQETVDRIGADIKRIIRKRR